MSHVGEYYDKTGAPITWQQFVRLKWDTNGPVSDYARIGSDTVDGVEVSTVWLGLNHAYAYTATPLIFESMIFGGDLDGECVRYTTEQEARAGHQRIVERLRAGKQPFDDQC